MASSRRLVLFTKPAIPGLVKTRLVGEGRGALTPERAAALHGAFLGDVAARLAGGDFALWTAWALADGEAVPAAPGQGFRQEGVGLGERLFHGLSRAAESAGGAEVVAALGSDHPTVELATVEEGFRRVEAGADVALGPSADGGYYLIAVARRALTRELFADIEWSSAGVFSQTMIRAASAGLAVSLLAEGHDVDRPEDLLRLAGLLAGPGAGATGLCPRTRALLAAWDLLPAEASAGTASR